MSPSQVPAPGNYVRLFGTYTYELADPPTLMDPTTATVMITPPPGSGLPIEAVTPIRDSVGQWHYDLLLTVAGLWLYRFIGAGAVVGQSENQRIDVPPL